MLKFADIDKVFDLTPEGHKVWLSNNEYAVLDSNVQLLNPDNGAFGNRTYKGHLVDWLSSSTDAESVEEIILRCKKQQAWCDAYKTYRDFWDSPDGKAIQFARDQIDLKRKALYKAQDENRETQKVLDQATVEYESMCLFEKTLVDKLNPPKYPK